jgi:hypothetical protein
MDNLLYLYYVKEREIIKVMMKLSQFIKELESSNHPNVVQLLPLLKGNLKEFGDVNIDLDKMKTLMEI